MTHNGCLGELAPNCAIASVYTHLGKAVVLQHTAIQEMLLCLIQSECLKSYDVHSNVISKWANNPMFG